jgi:hypothetical protein
MSDNINEVRNFGLACHTWALSQDLRKVASHFPKPSRRIHGHAKRLQAVSKEILSVLVALSRELVTESADGKPFNNISHAIQTLLDQCYELVKPIYAFYRVLKLCAEEAHYEPYLKIGQRYIVAFDPEVMDYVDKLLSGVEEILLRSSEA